MASIKFNCALEQIMAMDDYSRGKIIYIAQEQIQHSAQQSSHWSELCSYNNVYTLILCDYSSSLLCLVTISVPASLSVSEGAVGGTVEVCAELSGASPDTRTTSIISATLATIESSPGESGLGSFLEMYMSIFLVSLSNG
jgi:hypothetical protein